MAWGDHALGRFAAAQTHGKGREGLWEEIGRIEIVLAGYPDQCKQDVAPRIAQRRAGPMRGGGLADGTNRPVRGDPLPGGMGQKGGQSDLAAFLVDRGGLHGGDLVLAQALADNVEPTGQRRIAGRFIGGGDDR